MASVATSVDAGQHVSSALDMHPMPLEFQSALESQAVDGAATMPSFMRTPDISPHTNSQTEPTECTMIDTLPSTGIDIDTGNQPCPGPAVWGGEFDTEWASWLPGSDIDLDAINFSLLNAADVACEPFPPELPDTTQDTTVPTPRHVRRRWHTFSGMTPSGQTTLNVAQEQNPADETFRQRLAEHLRQRVQTGILPSASFLVLSLALGFFPRLCKSNESVSIRTSPFKPTLHIFIPYFPSFTHRRFAPVHKTRYSYFPSAQSGACSWVHRELWIME